MAVAFNQFPSNQRAPIFGFEVNGGPSPYQGNSRTILIGHKLPAGSAAVGAPILLGSGNPNSLFGIGSMLSDQALFARRANPLGSIYALPVAEPAGAAAAFTMTFSGTATGPGTFTRYVAGRRVSCTVLVGDTPTMIAAAFAAAINAGYTLFNRLMGHPVTTGLAAGVLTLTARHVGAPGNTIRIEAGLDGDEVDPAGVSCVIATGTAGSGDVDMAAALALLGSTGFDWATGPFNSSAQLNATRDFFANRWTPLVDLDGVYITAREGNSAALTAFGAGRNDYFNLVVGTLNSPVPSWSVAAGVAGQVGRSKNLGAALTEAIEVARPLQTIVVEGLRPAKLLGDRWSLGDRNDLYFSGIAALVARDDGQMAIDRLVTGYRTNAAGQPDITFLDVETVALAAYTKRYLKKRLSDLYPRHVLKDENPRNVQGIATPANLRAASIHAYRELCDAGLAEKPDLFAQLLVVERSSDPNRVNAFLPVDVANQLRVFAGNLTIFQTLDASLIS